MVIPAGAVSISPLLARRLVTEQTGNIATTAGSRIMSTLSSSFGGAFNSGVSTQMQSSSRVNQNLPNQQLPKDNKQTNDITQNVQERAVNVENVTPSSKEGDISSKLSESPIVTLLGRIDNNIKSLVLAVERGDLRSDRRKEIDDEKKQPYTADERGLAGSLLLALTPLLLDAFNRVKETISNIVESVQNTFNNIREGFNSAVESISNTLRGIGDSISSFFSGLISSIPPPAGPEQQPGGPQAETTREEQRREQRISEMQVQANRTGEAATSEGLQSFNTMMQSGRITSERDAERYAQSLGLSRGSEGFNEIMGAWSSYQQSRPEITTPTTTESYPRQEQQNQEVQPVTRNRTVDSRTSQVSREDRRLIDSTASTMGIDASRVTGAVISPSGEVLRLIERGGNTREVPPEIQQRNRAESRSVDQELNYRPDVSTETRNAMAVPDNFTGQESSTIAGVETSEEDALSVLNRIIPAIQRPVQQPAQSPVIMQQPVQQQATPNFTPPPGTGTPPRVSPHPMLLNEPPSPALAGSR